MLCKNCKKSFKKENPKSHNQKFCSLLCRNRFYYEKRGGAEYQREYLYKKQYKPSDAIKCQICGKCFRQVGSHVYSVHKMFARDYREAFGFDVKRGQVTEDLREIKAEHVFDNGTVENLKLGKKFWFKKGQKGIGTYKRSLQTMERLKNLHKFNRL